MSKRGFNPAWVFLRMGLVILIVAAGGCGLFRSEEPEDISSPVYRVAENLIEQGLVDEAITVLQNVIAIDPNSDNAVKAELKLGDLYLERNDLSSAEESYKAVMAGFPNHELAATATRKLQYLDALKQIRDSRTGLNQDDVP